MGHNLNIPRPWWDIIWKVWGGGQGGTKILWTSAALYWCSETLRIPTVGAAPQIEKSQVWGRHRKSKGQYFRQDYCFYLHLSRFRELSKCIKIVHKLKFEGKFACVCVHVRKRQSKWKDMLIVVWSPNWHKYGCPGGRGLGNRASW